MNREVSESPAEDFPGGATIEGDIHPEVGSDVQDIFVLGVFANDVDRFVGKITNDGLPGFALVGGLPKVGRPVIFSVAALAAVDDVFLVPASNNSGDPLLGLRCRDVGPGVASVRCHRDPSVVRTAIDEAELERAFAELLDR